jgi:transcriptional regulator with PAS, ATPase and Fis domain
MKTLLTWLGAADLKCMAEDKEAAIATIALHSHAPFGCIVILATTWESQWDDYVSWLKARLAKAKRPYQHIAINKADIKRPIDYVPILEFSEVWINKLSNESETLTISLTSGTPAMIAISVMLGKARSNVSFVQSSEKTGIEEVLIPFDFGKEYVKSAAKSIANTAVNDPKTPKLLEQIAAQSPNMFNLIRKAKILATSELPVLVLGETGTGKEIISKAIHLSSLRADKTFKAINCGALPQTLVDSILFGHEKGAFTGADKQHQGLFEQANSGTLFLDEVGELSPEVQVKLLRVLQEGSITRVGGSKEILVDVRIIAATHRNLLEMIESTDFREDLFYRLAIGVIDIPPLRERQEDIPILIEELTREINNTSVTQIGYKSKNVSIKGIEFILNQPWPGNIRELWNTLNRAFLWAQDKTITDKELRDAMIDRRQINELNDIMLSYNDKVDIVQLTDKYQKKYVEAALKASGNVKKHATQMLGIKDHQTLSNWMKRLMVEK